MDRANGEPYTAFSIRFDQDSSADFLEEVSVTMRSPIIRLARLLAEAPTTSYREHEVLHRIRGELDRIGMPHGSDRWGNLFAVYRARGSRGRPVAVTAHTDHPGLIVSSSSGRRAAARWLGGVQARYFKRGTSVRIEDPDGPIRGHVTGKELNDAGRVVRVRLQLEREATAGAIGGWDLTGFALRGKRIHTKSADDLMGCAGVLHLMAELVRKRPRIEVWGVFTRAEEVGLHGAVALAEDGTLPRDAAVVVLETSRELPCGRQGHGPILRVGDRLAVYDPGVSLALREACMDLAKRNRAFRWQRCLMDGGVCEATAFQAFGYPAGGLALALGNYHNMGETRIAEETINADDLVNLGRLLPVAVEKIALQRDPLARTRADFHKKAIPARKLMAATRDMPAPPKPPGRRALAALKGLAVGAALASSSLLATPARSAILEDPFPPTKPGAPIQQSMTPVMARVAEPMEGYDALHYSIRVRIDPNAGTIAGSVEMQIAAIDDLTDIEIHLGATLAADSAECEGTACDLERVEDDRIRVALPAQLRSGDTTRILLSYWGAPGPAYFSGFQFYSSHGQGNDTFPMVSTLSQPDRSRGWWPCKDLLSDKATVRLTIDAPGGFVVAAIGNRIQEEIAGDRILSTWETRYPIAPYLVAFAATDYAAWSDTYEAEDGAQIPLAFFAYPEDSAAARIDYHTAHEALARFESIFGPYPFRNPEVGIEKLGIAQFSWPSGAMEHQTLVSYGAGLVTGDNSNDPILAHEIAHQWFGDAVTPESMEHIWLNEGFATYGEALFAEGRGGIPGYRRWMARIRNPVDFEYRGCLARPTEWFTSTTYRKGAWVLHMLRGILGDERFFDAIRAYYEENLYGSVTTEDFVRTVEEESGEDLRWFFLPWLYGVGRPTLAWDWDAEDAGEDFLVRLLIRQTQEPIDYPMGSPSDDPPDQYAFPLTVRVFGRAAGGAADSLDSVVFVSHRTEVALLDHIPFEPERIVLDPDEWILREIVPGRFDDYRTQILCYPNPASGPVDVLLHAPRSGPTQVAVFDVSGRRVRRLGTIDAVGYHRLHWDGQSDAGVQAAAGIYWLRAEGSWGERSGRIVMVR